jgi:hypothetical protein
VTRDRIDVEAALDELRNELSIAPPPHFENRVRARVWDVRRANGVRSADRVVVRGVAARRADRSLVRRISTHALAGVVLITAVSFGRGMRLVSTAFDSTPTLTSRSARFFDGGTDLAAVVRRSPGALDGRIPSTRNSIPDASSRSSGRRDPFEVLVPPDQARALAQLLAAARSGVVPAERPIAVDPETGELLPPRPIEIAVLPAIPPLDPIDDGAGRDRR